MLDFLQKEFGGVPLFRYIFFFLIFLASLIIRKLFNKYLSKKLVVLTGKTKTKYDDLIVKSVLAPLNVLIIIAGLFFAISVLNLPLGVLNIQQFLIETLRVIISIVIVWIFYLLCTPVSEILRDLISKSDKQLADQFSLILRQALRVSVIVIGGILIIQNMGYSVSSLLAGLGVGGLAIALAAQDTVANLFGTFVMFTDKPFKVGDWIQFKDVDGDVESVGFRSTRVRTWGKSLKIIPNKLFTSEIIENWSKMPKRRVKMTIGLTYDSSPEKIEECVNRIKELLQNDDDINQDYILVNFTAFEASSLSIFIYYFTNTTVWAEYLAIRQRINLEIMKIVRELGLSFAFPSQSLYFENKLEANLGDVGEKEF